MLDERLVNGAELSVEAIKEAASVARSRSLRMARSTNSSMCPSPASGCLTLTTSQGDEPHAPTANRSVTGAQASSTGKGESGGQPAPVEGGPPDRISPIVSAARRSLAGMKWA